MNTLNKNEIENTKSKRSKIFGISLIFFGFVICKEHVWGHYFSWFALAFALQLIFFSSSCPRFALAACVNMMGIRPFVASSCRFSRKTSGLCLAGLVPTTRRRRPTRTTRPRPWIAPRACLVHHAKRRLQHRCIVYNVQWSGLERNVARHVHITWWHDSRTASRRFYLWIASWGVLFWGRLHEGFESGYRWLGRSNHPGR